MESTGKVALYAATDLVGVVAGTQVHHEPTLRVVVDMVCHTTNDLFATFTAQFRRSRHDERRIFCGDRGDQGANLRQCDVELQGGGNPDCGSCFASEAAGEAHTNVAQAGGECLCDRLEYARRALLALVELEYVFSAVGAFARVDDCIELRAKGIVLIEGEVYEIEKCSRGVVE